MISLSLSSSLPSMEYTSAESSSRTNAPEFAISRTGDNTLVTTTGTPIAIGASNTMNFDHTAVKRGRDDAAICQTSASPGSASAAAPPTVSSVAVTAASPPPPPSDDSYNSREGPTKRSRRNNYIGARTIPSNSFLSAMGTLAPLPPRSISAGTNNSAPSQLMSGRNFPLPLVAKRQLSGSNLDSFLGHGNNNGDAMDLDIPSNSRPRSMSL